MVAEPSRLLVNQLLMTDAFGLASDESLEVEGRKLEYRALRDKGELGQDESERLAFLKRELAEVAHGGGSDLILENEHGTALRAIREDLRAHREADAVAAAGRGSSSKRSFEQT